MAMPFESMAQEWQAPRWDARESRKLGWLNEQAQQGESWNKSQRGTGDYLRNLQILAGTVDMGEALEYRSTMSSGRLKTNASVVVAGLSAIRPWGGFQSTDAYKSYALAINRTTRALYLSNFWDQSIKAALQWCMATATSFVRPVYRRKMAGHGRGSIMLDVFGLPSVLPVQMPSDGDYQRAYCVTLLDEQPVWEAHGRWPLYQHRLTPTSSRYWYSAEIRRASQENANRRYGWNPFKRNTTFGATDNLIPIRYTTINDLDINTTGRTITMGEEGSPWAYDVPSYNQDFQDANGIVRKANADDARMYPYRRLMISSENVVMYDGPAFNWHGELDLIPFCLDKWPWEPTGFSLLHDGYKIQHSIDKIDRGTMDKIVADLDRPLAYNINAVNKMEADRVDLMQPRQRIGFDGDQVDKPFQAIAPDDVYKVSAESMVFRDKLKEDLDYLMQSRDIVELSKSRALGRGIDQLEALISANGPLVKDKSRAMEKSVCGIANQVKWLMLQYMDTSEILAYNELDDTPQTFDFDPSSIVPSHLPGQPTMTDTGELIASPTKKVQRARWIAERLPFTMTPHSIHEIHQMNYRLMLLQMKQRGFPIADCDIMEANDIPDVKIANGNTSQDRFWNEKLDTLTRMQDLKLKAMGLVDVDSLLGMAAGKQPEGRPPTAQSPPQLQMKGDGRPVISESES